MKKFLSLALTFLMIDSAFAAGRLQNEDFKTLAELTAAGGSASQLLNDSKLYLTGGALNKQLSTAIGDGSLFAKIQPLTTKGDTLAYSTAPTRLGVGADGQVLTADSTQATGLRWGAGGSGGGAKNYLGNGDAEYGTTGWVTYADAAGATPVDGTGGTPTVTFGRTNATTMAGNYYFTFTKPASNVQGQGFSYDFTIDSSAQGKVQQIMLDTQVISGTFAAGAGSPNPLDSDVEFFIYDKTNNVVIQPTTYKIFSNSTTLASPFIANFQAASNSTSYRLIGHVATTSTAAFVLGIDSILVSPTNYSTGTTITDWTNNRIPTFNGLGTVTGGSFLSRRVGGNLEMYGYVMSGTVQATIASINLPVTIDAARLPVAPTGVELGRSYSPTSGVTYVWPGTNGASDSSQILFYDNADATKLFFSYREANNVFNKDNGNGIFGTGRGIPFYFNIPVLGWATQQQQSDVSDQRIVALRYTASANTTMTTGTPISYAAKSFDTHAAWNGSSFTAPVPGIYSVAFMIDSASDGVAYVYKNGANFGTVGNYRGSSFGSQNFKTLVPLNAGETLDVRGSNGTQAGGAALTSSYIDISRIANPSQMSATETVAASYFMSVNQTCSTTVPCNFDSKEYDTHGAVTVGTGWRFTAPQAGLYSLISNARSDTASDIILYKNGTVYKFVGRYANTANFAASLGTDIRLNAGEYIELRPTASVTLSGGTLSAAPTGNIAIRKVGI